MRLQSNCGDGVAGAATCRTLRNAGKDLNQKISGKILMSTAVHASQDRTEAHWVKEQRSEPKG